MVFPGVEAAEKHAAKGRGLGDPSSSKTEGNNRDSMYRLLRLILNYALPNRFDCNM